MPTVTSENKEQFYLDELAKKGIIKPVKLTEEELREAKDNMRNFKNIPDASVDGLRDAFANSIAKHISLFGPARIANSKRIRDQIGDIVGRYKDSVQPKPLLSSNGKLGKAAESVTLPGDIGVETWGVSLTPAFHAGNLQGCKNANVCIKGCLGNESGQRRMSGVKVDSPQYASMMRTRALLTNPGAYAVRVYDEVDAKRADAAKRGNHLGVRLNTLSDLDPRIYKPIHDALPDVSFYDYTKNLFDDPVSENHHLTYSANGLEQPAGLNGMKETVKNPHNNWDWCRYRLAQGHNVAMVFSHKDHLPKEVHDLADGETFQVLDGRTHDFRPIDGKQENGKGYIIGLSDMEIPGEWQDKAKTSKGFQVHFDPKPIKDFSQPPKVAKNGRKTYPTIATNEVYYVAPQSPSRPLVGNNGEKITLADKIAHDKLLGLAPPEY